MTIVRFLSRDEMTIVMGTERYGCAGIVWSHVGLAPNEFKGRSRTGCVVGHHNATSSFP